MSNLKTFLKALEKSGYPNPQVPQIANIISYPLDDFLLDLKNEIGEKGVVDFCEKAIAKLTGEKGLRVEPKGPIGNEYVYIHIYPIFYDEDESETDIICRSAYGESNLLTTNEKGQREYRTIEEIIDDSDMGSWSELDDFIDELKENAYNKVFENCGFGIWWQ